MGYHKTQNRPPASARVMRISISPLLCTLLYREYFIFLSAVFSFLVYCIFGHGIIRFIASI